MALLPRADTKERESLDAPDFWVRNGGLSQVVARTLRYFQGRQLPDGSIVDDQEILIFQEWDSVNALKAIACWRDRVPYEDAGTVARAVDFLRSREKTTGMLNWGDKKTGPEEYCTETSSEYIAGLTALGLESEALPKAEFLRARQLAVGAWEEAHPHIPKAFQTESSVTGFALLALLGLDLNPLYEDQALRFLAAAQRPEGHFGFNWYYYGTYYYLMRPAIAALAEYGHHAVVAKARDFVLSQQLPEGNWYDQVSGFGDYSSSEQHTALALGVLAHSGMQADQTPVRRGLQWLLDRQRDDGSWNGGAYPYPETESYQSFRATQHIFTTAQVLSALHHFSMLEDPHV